MNNAKLIFYSQPTEGFELPKTDLKNLVAYVARVSNPSNQMNTDTSDKLVNYLVNNKHWSPLEMVSLTMEITTTRDIARQLLRHRSFSFQEWSNRYANPVNDLGFETREARLQDTKNRQNSIKTEDKELAKLWQEKQQQVIHSAKEVYDWAVSNGVAKEQARSVLPEGNTVSRLYMAGTLRSFLHYGDVRTDVSTQLEHRELAESIKQEVNKVFNLL